LVLSPRLAKGMDYSKQAWDDSAMVLRRGPTGSRSESLDHPAAGSKKDKKSEAAAEAKKSHLPGPGLAVFDRAADPERAEVNPLCRRVCAGWCSYTGTRGCVVFVGQPWLLCLHVWQDELALQRRWVRPANDRASVGIGFLAFLRTDLLAPSTPPVIEDAIPRGVANFLRVPLLFERFVAFGVFASLDMFLYVLTFLPLRTLASVGRFALGCAATPALAAVWCLTPALKRLGWRLLVAALGDPESIRAEQRAAAGKAAGEDLDADLSGDLGRKVDEAWVRGPSGLFGPDSPWRWLRPTFHRTHGYGTNTPHPCLVYASSPYAFTSRRAASCVAPNM
jgi:hypothetical protein